MNDTATALPSFTEQATEIVTAYVSHNSVPAAEVPNLLRSVHEALSTLDKPVAAETEPAKLIPPVSIKKSVTDEYLISMEDGKRYQSLKRHLSKRGLTPADYRAKWGLPADYPMTAAGYSARRSELAKTIGLGQIRRKGAAAAVEPVPAPEPEPEPEPAAPAPKKGRARKAA